MMKVKTLGEIMIPLEEYSHINHRATLREASEAFIKAQITDKAGRKSLPRKLLVFDDIHQLVGFVRRRHILLGLEPPFLANRSLIYREGLFDMDVDPNLTEMFYEKIISGMREKADAPVTYVREPIVRWLNYDDHIAKGIFEIVRHDVSLMPIVKGEKVVGVVRTVDLFSEVYEFFK